MKHFRFAAVCLLASSTSAFSAGLLAGSSYDWSGFSAGVFGGWQWANIDQTELFTEAFGGGWWFPPGPNPGHSYDDDAGIFGVQLAWDHQSGSLVAGFGAELGTMNLDTYVADPNSPPIPFPGPAGPETAFSGDLFGSLTGRLGFASDRWLTYVRAGVSLLDAEATTINSCRRSFCGQLTIDASSEDLLLGVTAGAGFEYAVSGDISVGAEYRLYSFEALTVAGVASNFLTYEQEVTPDIIHTARLGLNFRF